MYPTDIAAAAAEELTASATTASLTQPTPKIRYVASDERTVTEVAQVLGTAIGQPHLPWLTFLNEQVQANLEKTGMPLHLAASMVALGASIHTGKLGEDY